jgi:hypothetical protein
MNESVGNFPGGCASLIKPFSMQLAPRCEMQLADKRAERSF